MKIHRFFVPAGLLPSASELPKSVTILDEELFHQWKNVLRLKPDEWVVLCDGKGMDAQAMIVGYGKKSVEVSIESLAKNESEPSHRVRLYCAALKRENFELVVQKAVEVGVSEIIPLITRRTIKTHVKHERLEKIAKEAAEQSGRGVVPTVHEARSFEDVLESAKNDEPHYFFDFGGEEFSLPTSSSSGQSISLYIGPEGGWDEQEHQAAKKAGMKIVSLGQRVLRGETAAIVATFLASR